jgi:hypothetical protein
MILKVVPVIWNMNAALSRSIVKAGFGAVKNSVSASFSAGSDVQPNAAMQKMGCRKFRQPVLFAHKLYSLLMKHPFFWYKN